MLAVIVDRSRSTWLAWSASRSQPITTGADDRAPVPPWWAGAVALVVAAGGPRPGGRRAGPQSPAAVQPVTVPRWFADTATICHPGRSCSPIRLPPPTRRRRSPGRPSTGCTTRWPEAAVRPAPWPVPGPTGRLHRAEGGSVPLGPPRAEGQPRGRPGRHAPLGRDHGGGARRHRPARLPDRARGTTFGVAFFTAVLGSAPVRQDDAWVWSGSGSAHPPVATRRRLRRLRGIRAGGRADVRAQPHAASSGHRGMVAAGASLGSTGPSSKVQPMQPRDRAVQATAVPNVSHPASGSRHVDAMTTAPYRVVVDGAEAGPPRDRRPPARHPWPRRAGHLHQCDPPGPSARHRRRRPPAEPLQAGEPPAAHRLPGPRPVSGPRLPLQLQTLPGAWVTAPDLLRAQRLPDHRHAVGGGAAQRTDQPEAVLLAAGRRLLPPLVLTVALLGIYAAFVHVADASQRLWGDGAGGHVLLRRLPAGPRPRALSSATWPRRGRCRWRSSSTSSGRC